MRVTSPAVITYLAVQMAPQKSRRVRTGGGLREKKGEEKKMKKKKKKKQKTKRKRKEKEEEEVKTRKKERKKEKRRREGESKLSSLERSAH